jgi:hypothetical protein
MNNVIEQDHGFIKKRITAGQGFRLVKRSGERGEIRVEIGIPPSSAVPKRKSEHLKRIPAVVCLRQREWVRMEHNSAGPSTQAGRQE